MDDASAVEGDDTDRNGNLGATRQTAVKFGVDGSALAAPRSGVGNYTEALLTPLIDQHLDVQFVVYSPKPIDLAPRPNLCVVTESWPMPGPLWRNIRLPFLLRRDRIDVFWSATGFLPAGGIRKIATVLTVHDFVYLFAGETMPRLGRLSRSVFQPWSARSATRVVAISRQTAADMERIYGRTADAIIPPVVSGHFGIPTEAERKRIRQKFALPESYLFTVGTLEPRKNLSAVLAAYDRLHQEGIRPPKLIIAGGKGWKNRYLSEALQKAQQKGFAQVLGFVEDRDLAGLYGCALAFLFPSLYEGFGMPLVEAQLCGTPVIYGHHAAMREAAGGIGVIIEPTCEGIAVILRQLADETCRLACRLPSDISNSPAASAGHLWQVVMDSPKGSV